MASVQGSQDYLMEVLNQAKTGDADAQWRLGSMLEKYSSLDKEVFVMSATAWLEKAAEQGHSSALVSLGKKYEDGNGVPKDWTRARELYERSAVQSNGAAYYNLGLMHLMGRGVAQDDARALELLTLAVDKGVVAMACAHLAEMHKFGKGTPVNLERAAELFMLCAERFDPDLRPGSKMDPPTKRRSDKQYAEKARCEAEFCRAEMRKAAQPPVDEALAAADAAMAALLLEEKRGEEQEQERLRSKKAKRKAKRKGRTAAPSNDADLLVTHLNMTPPPPPPLPVDPTKCGAYSATGPALDAVEPVMPAPVKPPDDYVCPITLEVMRDPVVAADGHTYERDAIECWLASHDTSPKSGHALEGKAIVPNHLVRRQIREWQEGSACRP